MRKWVIRGVIKLISKADACTIDYILDTAMKRKRELYPDWELFYCAAPKDTISGPEDMIRRAILFEKMLKGKYG